MTHIHNARSLGATAQEIMEVFEIVSVIGIHGALIAAPMLESMFPEAPTQLNTSYTARTSQTAQP